MATIEETVAGISFALSDEQRALRELAREFAAKEIRPKAAEYDEHATHPADLIAKAHDLGLMNVHLPEELGGPELSAFASMLIGEELSWGCAGIAVSIVANTLGSAPVLIAGDDEQKREWLPPLLDAPQLCSFGLSEPDAGSDVARIKTSAERRGDEYVLNGSKTFITNAGRAAWTVVFAKTDPTKGHRGLSAFIVPTSSSRPRTGSVRKATASRSPCRRSTRRGRAQRPARSESPRPPTSLRSTTRRSGSRATCRSRCTRA